MLTRVLGTTIARFDVEWVSTVCKLPWVVSVRGIFGPLQTSSPLPPVYRLVTVVLGELPSGGVFFGGSDFAGREFIRNAGVCPFGAFHHRSRSVRVRRCAWSSRGIVGI